MLREDDLRTRLHALADPVQGAADPVTGVRERAGKLRRYRMGTTVTLGLVLVLATGLAAGYAPLHRRAAPGAPSSSSALPPAKAPDLSHLRTAQEVWPDAVRRLPEHLSDGRGYEVSGALGAGRYLIEVRVGFDLYGDMAILDTRHGDALTVLSAADAGQSASQYQPQKPVLTADGVAWVALAQRDGQWTTEVWASDLTARSGRLVATLAGRSVVGPMQAWVVGERVVFDGMSGDTAGPMYWVPRSGGGQPKEFPGSRGRWPLTGGWTAPTRQFGLVARSQVGEGEATLLNVLTGKRVPIRPNPSFQSIPYRTALYCAPAWCLGPVTGADGTRHAAVQHPDGTGYAETGPADPTTMFGGGRFAVGYVGVGTDQVQGFIWDVVTGAAGTFGPPMTAKSRTGVVVPDPGQDCYAWPDASGTMVFDGTAFG